MIKKIIKSILAGGILLAIILPTHAGTPHTSYGIVSGGQTGDSWKFYVVARPSEILTGTLESSNGQYFWRALVGNLPTPWALGDDSLVFIKRETGAGTASHRGYYAVMNEDLSNVNPQPYNNCTMREIPVPTATAGTGVVNLSWTAAQTDTSETPHGNNIAGYNVYRSTSQSSGFTKINSSLVTGTNYTDSSGTAGTTYYYAIEPVFRGEVALGIYSANSNSVVFPSAPFNFSLSVKPTSGSVQQGNSTTATVTATLTSGTTQNVSLSASGQPAGVTITFSPSSGNPTFSSTMTINVGSSVTPETYNITISGTGGGVTKTATYQLTVTSTPPTNEVSISSITPNNPYIGQTIVISGSGFGASKGSSTVTIGGVTANPTAWSNNSITLAVPSGVVDGNVVVTVGGQTATSTITLQTGGVVIDDIEGGCVGTWPDPTSGLAQSGYYAFGSGIEPDNSNITANGPQAEACKHGAKGMKVKYSYTSNWGGGWGAKLANTLDLSSYDTISFYVKWDGSTNNIKLALKDNDGTSVATTISNSTLAPFTANYGKVTVNKSSFTADPDGSDPGNNGTFDWTKVTNYNFVYNTTGTSTNYQYIDSIIAGDVNLGTGEVVRPIVTGEVTITSVTPPAGPAGTKITINGSGFGDAQGQSQLLFENSQTKVTYQVEVLSWSANTIEAIVPRLASIGTYNLKVIKIAITAGTMQAFESNPASFQVTAGMSAAGVATIYPNPFNPLATGTTASGAAANSTTVAFNAGGATNVGIYIYDSTGRLVYKTITNASQISWNGRDNSGNVVGDGLYLLRVVNEDSKSVIAKGKILVIKK